MVEVKDKYTGKVIGQVPSISTDQLTSIINKAAKSFSTYRDGLPLHKRAEILQETSSILLRRSEDFAGIIAREGGKPIKAARREAKRASLTMKFSAEEAKRIHGETIPFEAEPRGEDRIGYWYRVPAGLVAAITPFNDPLNLVAHKLGPAIAAGNTVVLKPASLTPLSATKLTEALVEAGLPTDYVTVVTGDGQTLGPVLVQNPNVRVVTFTGGVEAGEKLAKLAGIKKIAMELGSNCPVIVMDDAALDFTTECVVSAGFSCQGQNCIHAQRILIHETHYEELTNRLVEEARKLRVGNPMDEATDVGPMISESEAMRVEEWIKEAVAKGANLLVGGERKGPILNPTILSDVPNETKLANDEIFGPVMAISKFSKLSEAIRNSNSTNYGLHAGIFTSSIDNALNAISGLNFGSVLINDTSDFRVDFMPFGGMKMSGLGREGIRFAIEETMTEIKTVIYRKPRSASVHGT